MAWHLTQTDVHDYVITGPGALEMALHDFAPTTVGRPEDLGAAVLGTLMQRTWRYEIEPGLWLELISTCDTAALDRRELHRLHLGHAVTWRVPDHLAEAIHALGARPEVP